MAFFIAIAVPLAALLLLFLGLRGSRINDHPTCAACRFDLIGLTSPTTCPECGAALDRPRATRIGTRRRLPAPIAVGSFLLLLSVLVATILLGGTQLNKYKPSWLLILEAQHRLPSQAAEVVAELIARSDRSELSNAARAQLARRSLEIQSNPLLPWSRDWANVLTDSTFAAQLTPAEQNASALVGADAKILFRQRVRAGQGIPIEIGMPISERFLAAGRRATAESIHIALRDAAGQVIRQNDQPCHCSMNTFMGGWSSSFANGFPILSAGEYRYEITCPITLGAFGPGTRCTLNVRTEGPLKVLDADESSVELIHGAGIKEQLAGGLTISGQLSSYSNGRQWLGLSVGIQGAAMGADGALFNWAKANQTFFVFTALLSPAADPDAPEIPGGTLALRFNDGGWVIQPGGTDVDANFAPGAYRLRLVPNIESAERSMEDNRIFGDELVLEVQVTPMVMNGTTTFSQSPLAK